MSEANRPDETRRDATRRDEMRRDATRREAHLNGVRRKEPILVIIYDGGVCACY